MAQLQPLHRGHHTRAPADLQKRSEEGREIRFKVYIIVLSYFSGPQGPWGVHVCCLHLKMEFCLCARGRQWCGIIHVY